MVIISRDVTFRENIFNKDDLAIASNRSKKPEGKYSVVYDEIFEKDIAKPINTAQVGEILRNNENLTEFQKSNDSGNIENSRIIIVEIC